MVTVDGLGKLLKEHPFFAGWSDDYRELLSGCASNHRFDPGTIIGREGEPADKFYLIRHGAVALEFPVPGRDPVVIETLHEGEVFGWSWMVPPYTWAYDVRATELCRAIGMDAECLRRKCDRDHSLGYELYKRFMPLIAERMNSARVRLLDVYGIDRQGG
jgi:CRP/FNR family cyclic AMP-dependent transcriptional regulator